MTRDPWFWIVVVAIVLALGGGAFWRARKRVSRAKIDPTYTEYDGDEVN